MSLNDDSLFNNPGKYRDMQLMATYKLLPVTVEHDNQTRAP